MKQKGFGVGRIEFKGIGSSSCGRSGREKVP